MDLELEWKQLHEEESCLWEGKNEENNWHHRELNLFLIKFYFFSLSSLILL